ncbi:hypothetical protein BOX15_Mlig031352g2 [Macrostomum lignano]|uniref:Uncharacterized protein n=2 Tax=Macrostomum lignano TaxID=282301 RepID=A0A267ESD7_9PLAT|nr:hypothetical protein BOX15_Mlig031352g1 [Macrostomum lignano]PAA76464.1 hypothetical protein BOX15_Mlig031352g3 [Macrostomum lignano]PAA76479.1 hypothetical protein BOX15_Mlig031352g2 [Macrostomum lignano]
METETLGSSCDACGKGCRGYRPHTWRALCIECQCAKASHLIYAPETPNLLKRLGYSDTSPFMNVVEEQLKIAESVGYVCSPLGLEKTQIVEFAKYVDPSVLPRIRDRSACLERLRRVHKQVPPQDVLQTACKSLENSQKNQFERLKDRRNRKALGLAEVHQVSNEDAKKSCHGCGERIVKPGKNVQGDSDRFVLKASHAEGMLWHPSCFQCAECKDHLVDFFYCWSADKNDILCVRDFNQSLRSRCPACDELIFSVELTRSMEGDHHTGHFACSNCDKSLTGHRYILREEKPFCIQCYEDIFANTCEQCKDKIGCDSKDLSYKDRHWHERCFKCSSCSTSLVDKPFATKEEALFCSDCHDEKFAARCDGCSKVFRAGMRKYEYRGKQWHEECFLCLECRLPIGTKSFIPRDQDVCCVPCYEEKYAQRCSKCTQVIKRGGVTYKGDPYHKECLVCANCTTQLAGVKFTSKDEKPYCAECYGQLFAKKCCRCTQPITGFGGCKFISFEERHWHSECFVCYKCDINLVGKGFLTDGDEILCPECGR